MDVKSAVVPVNGKETDCEPAGTVTDSGTTIEEELELNDTCVADETVALRFRLQVPAMGTVVVVM